MGIHYFSPILYGRDLVELPLFPYRRISTKSLLYNMGRNSVVLPLFFSYIYRRAACNSVILSQPGFHTIVLFTGVIELYTGNKVSTF